MPEKIESESTADAVLVEKYKLWLKYLEQDASSQIVLHRPSFRGGMTSTLHLLPRYSARFQFGPFRRSVSSAILHDWVSVGGDL